MTEAEIQICAQWLELCKLKCFGLILPNGWFGRPFDNQHRIDSYLVSKDFIEIQFDDTNKIRVFKPSHCSQVQDVNRNNCLLIGEFESVCFEGNGLENLVFQDGKLQLVGYYFY